MTVDPRVEAAARKWASDPRVQPVAEVLAQVFADVKGWAWDPRNTALEILDRADAVEAPIARRAIAQLRDLADRIDALHAVPVWGRSSSVRTADLGSVSRARLLIDEYDTGTIAAAVSDGIAQRLAECLREMWDAAPGDCEPSMRFVDAWESVPALLAEYEGTADA